MNKVAIFDLDGTLLNSISDIALCANQALELSGLAENELEDYKRFVGWGVDELIQKMMTPKEYTVHGGKVKADYTKLYGDRSAQEGTSYEGISEMLRRLREAGYKTAVVSNKPDSMTRSVQTLTYPGLLDMALGQREGVPLKPDPTLVLQVIETLGGSLETAVYVGDSDVDVMTGKNAGIFTIAVTWGYRPKELLKNCKPDRLVDTVEELEREILQRG